MLTARPSSGEWPCVLSGCTSMVVQSPFLLVCWRRAVTSPQNPGGRNHWPAPASTSAATGPARALPAHPAEELSGSLQLPLPRCRWGAAGPRRAAGIALRAVGGTCNYTVVVQGRPSTSLGGMAPFLGTMPGPQPQTLQVLGAHLGAPWTSEAFGASPFSHLRGSLDCWRNPEGSCPGGVSG